MYKTRSGRAKNKDDKLKEETTNALDKKRKCLSSKQIACRVLHSVAIGGEIYYTKKPMCQTLSECKYVLAKECTIKISM